jgi:carbamoyl-phosphate synthase large subunit
MNILFTNSGRRTYLIKNALALKDRLFPDLKIFVSDSSYNVASFWVSPHVNNIITPRVDIDNNLYIEKLLVKCEENSINLLIPLMDYELMPLSKNKDRFKRIGVTIVVSSPYVVQHCLDKSLYKDFCNKYDLLTPATWLEGQVIHSDKDQIILKKVTGSGSVDLKIVNHIDIPYIVPEGFLAQELINGQEYGIDVFNNLKGEYTHSCIKRKIRMRSGETDAAEVLDFSDLNFIGEKIGSAFGHIGNLDVDFIVNNDNKIYFIDFNPRFGGGYPFTLLAGADYLKLIISEFMGVDSRINNNVKNIFAMKGVEILAKYD